MTSSTETALPQAEVAGQHARIGALELPTEAASARTTHPAAQWFPEAGIGLFLHWGISSVRGEGDLSWSLMAHPPGRRARQSRDHGSAAVQKTLTPRAYWAQAEQFRPDRYDPAKWLAAAKAAGFRYAVFTTKHHDGYTLWPSAFGELGTRTCLGGRDLVADYVAACREAGLKVGFYYSPPDWYFERERMSFRYGGGKPDLGLDHEPVLLDRVAIGQSVGLLDDEQVSYEFRFRRLVRGQVEELLTRYGPVDLIWFDGYGHEAISIERIRELQPGIVISPRAHGDGDYETFECAFPKTRPSGWWEYCHLWADGGWGYLQHEIYKPTGWMISEFVKARSWGGNFLPNIAPDSHGELPPVAYQRLQEFGEWMKRNEEAVIGVEPGPWPARSNVPVTIRGTTWYLHATHDFDEVIEIREISRPTQVRLLDREGVLKWSHEEQTLRIEIPGDLRSVLVDVVRVDWEAEA